MNIISPVWMNGRQFKLSRGMGGWQLLMKLANLANLVCYNVEGPIGIPLCWKTDNLMNVIVISPVWKMREDEESYPGEGGGGGKLFSYLGICQKNEI